MAMSRTRAALCMGALCVLLAGCAALVDFGGLEGGCHAPCVDGASPVDGEGPPLDGSVVGDAGGEASAAVDAGVDGPPTIEPDAGPCPGKAGPVGVRIPVRAGKSFCVDPTEVTNAEYQAFVEAAVLPDGGTTAAGAGVCSWNADVRPAAGYPPAAGREKYPVTYVDWCDARAYCAWAGKRLCGAVGGGALAFPFPPGRPNDQWLLACAGANATKYPYGNAYVAKTCNGLENGAGVTLQSLATCVGGYSGVRDMSGNVWEWVDACDGAVGASDLCFKAGGSFNSPEPELVCDFPSGAERRDTHLPNVGFRCCSEP